MKKILATALLAGTVLAGAMTTTHTFASTPDNEDGTQTVLGESVASLDTVGLLGQFDPETIDPGLPGLPDPGDDSWIKVKVPTTVAYSSYGSAHDKIGSPDHAVTNLSVYPVSVSVTNFTGADAAVDVNLQNQLDLVAGSKTVNLIKDGVASTVAKTEMFKLGSNPDAEFATEEGIAVGGGNINTFKFTGLTDPDKSTILGSEQTAVENKLHLSFKALAMDGSVPTK